MRRTLAIAVLLFLVTSGNARTEILLSDFIEVLGSVSNATRPVENAVVVAFNLSTYYVAQTFTRSDGTFRLPALPAGIYRIIAVKNGFVPAVMTVAPNQKDLRVALKLRAAAPEDARNAIWEIRRSLPSDVLREIDLGAIDEAVVADADEPARISGEMTSFAALNEDRHLDSSYARTAVGVRGELGRGWKVDFAGELQMIGDDEVQGVDSTLAESSGVRMEIRPSDSNAYRFTSKRNSWMLDAEEVDLQAHRFEWQRQNASVQVRYVAHENLFPNPAYNAQVFEVSGEGRLQKSPRSDIDLFLKIGQENFTGHAASAYQTAAVSATGRFAVLPAVRLRYGMHTFVTENRSEWAPETGAEFQVAKNASIVIAGLYKVLRADDVNARLPSVVFLNQGGALSPRYRYSIAFVSGDERQGISAAANVAEIDSVVRVVFDDRFDQFWDAFFLESGDIYQDVTLTARKQFGRILLVDFTTTAGRADKLANVDDPDEARSYVTGTVQSIFRPSGTSLEVSYRQIESPTLDGGVFDSERLNLRMGQSLHLPLNVRVLLGVDLARAPESPVLVDAHAGDSLQRRLVGGISFAF